MLLCLVLAQPAFILDVLMSGEHHAHLDGVRPLYIGWCGKASPLIVVIIVVLWPIFDRRALLWRWDG